ncbi:MAG: ABC transporter ATP-binding protein [Candidatus Ornithospirochaeta sp.]
MSYLEINELRKDYSDFNLSLSFSVEKGELVTILGPSGSGKSTLLSLLSGIESADSGEIKIDGKDIIKLPISKRGISMVFQDFSLFPGMNTRKNIEYGMKEKNGKKRDQKADELLNTIGLNGYGKRKVTSLSGGEAQRVALARAIASEPDILLLDEPLSALDAPLRKKLRGSIRAIHDAFSTTMLYVTHDREEAFAISDKIIRMRGGKIEAYGTPEELYKNPPNLFTAFFTGDGTALPASLIYGEGTEGSVFFRPESVTVSEESIEGGLYPNHLVFNNVEVLSAEYTGPGYMLGLSFKGMPIIAFSPLKPKKRIVSLMILMGSVIKIKS